MSTEARLILSAYRPNGQDSGDPTFTASLAAAERDAALAQWLAEQQEFDRVVAGHLRAVAVPADLRARILAGAEASRRRSWWSRPRWWALAAVFVVLASVAALWPGKTPGLADWQRRGLAVLDGMEADREHFDFEHPDAAILVAWLGQHAVPKPSGLPAALAGQKTYGCKTIAWDGHKMSLICFDLGDGTAVHLFTTDRAGLARVPPDGPPRMVHEGRWTVALWSEGDKTLMLVSDQGEKPLRRVLRIAASFRTRERLLAA